MTSTRARALTATAAAALGLAACTSGSSAPHGTATTPAAASSMNLFAPRLLGLSRAPRRATTTARRVSAPSNTTVRIVGTGSGHPVLVRLDTADTTVRQVALLGMRVPAGQAAVVLRGGTFEIDAAHKSDRVTIPAAQPSAGAKKQRYIVTATAHAPSRLVERSTGHTVDGPFGSTVVSKATNN